MLIADPVQRRSALLEYQRSILQACSDASLRCGAKILCIMVLPMDDPAQPAPRVVREDRPDGNMEVFSGHGSVSVTFDSFSPKGLIELLNPVPVHLDRVFDPSRHFRVDFNVKVHGHAAAVLDAASVKDYLANCTRSAPSVKPLSPRPITTSPIKIRTPFDEELERRKRQCAIVNDGLLSIRAKRPRTAPAKKPPPVAANSFASALLAPAPLPSATPFGQLAQIAALASTPLASLHATPQSSYETVQVCSVPKRDVLILPNLQFRNSNEEYAFQSLGFLSAVASKLKH